MQGPSGKRRLEDIAGMRMATTVQMIRMDDNLNVTVGQGEWSDKIGAGELGWFIAWPLAVTAGVGAYKQKKLPEEIFQVIEQCIVSGGRSVVVRNAGAELNAVWWFAPPAKPSVRPRQILQQLRGEAGKQIAPVRGGDTARKPLLRSMRSTAFLAGRSGAIKGGDCVCAGEKTAGAAKRRMAFQYAAGGMPDDRGPSPVCFGGGGICARGTPAGRATKTRCSGTGRQERPPAIALNTRHSCCWATMWVESKAVEIDTYLFFTNDVVTRPQEEYTIRVRARWIMIVGDPDGQYMVADVGEAEPPHEHSYTKSTTRHSTGRRAPAAKG